MPKKRKQPRKSPGSARRSPWGVSAAAVEMSPELVEAMAEYLGGVGVCDGQQIDHRDGSMSCTRGLDCAGIALAHHGWTDCPEGDSCDACAGRITWVCDGTTVLQ